jgi:hypothetical protein
MKVKGSLAKFWPKGYLLILAVDQILDGWNRLQSKERETRPSSSTPVGGRHGRLAQLAGELRF